MKRRKKKIPSQLISFDDDLSRPEFPDVNSPLYHSAPTTCLSSPSPTTGGATPYADRLEKLVHLQELQQAKEALKSSEENSVRSDNCDLGDERMGNTAVRLKSEAAEHKATAGLDLEGAISIEENVGKYDDESLNEACYQEIYERILPKHSNVSLESDNNTHDNNSLSFVPVPKSRRPSNLYDQQETGSYRSSQSNISANSFPSSEGDVGAAGFTPIGSEKIRGLIPVSPRSVGNFDGVQSDDDNSINSYCQEGEEGAAAVSRVTGTTQVKNRGTCTSPNSVTSTLPSPSSGDTTLTLDELKSAVLEISRARDAAECRRTEIASALAQEMETTSMLRAEIAHQNGLHQEGIERLNTKINALQRENELLKHQLKKYVGAVQLLRREGSVETVTPQPPRNTPDYRDYHDEAAAYEKKLIQVAEMHGELMEFNERLHKLLRMREAQVRRLRDELIDLRGPLPDDHDEEDEIDETASVTSDLDTLSVSTTPRTLINLWIPTAFLTGSSSDTHHVYQVSICFDDDIFFFIFFFSLVLFL